MSKGQELRNLSKLSKFTCPRCMATVTAIFKCNRCEAFVACLMCLKRDGELVLEEHRHAEGFDEVTFDV